MLSGYVATPTLAVKDLQRARDFYEGVLGLSSPGDVPDGIRYSTGSGSILVYPSAYAGTNKATAVGFQVPERDFDSVISALRDKGVVFQTFEMDGITWNDGVASFEFGRAAWFEDPDGNIIAIDSEPSPG